MATSKTTTTKTTAKKSKAKSTSENNLKQKLEYIGLNLEKLPSFLKKYTPLDFRISNGVNEVDQIIYKYVPINKIQILITPSAKDEELRLKYTKGEAISRYLDINGEDNVDKYTVFLNMVNMMDIDEIEDIEEAQERLDKEIPFKIKYPKNFLWNIYYAQATDTYFMLVCIDDLKYNNMFYLLKSQIDFYKTRKKVAPRIFVPITQLDYSREIFSKTEIKDIENYLWILAGEWAKIYEVYDKQDTPSIHIVGQAKVYEEIKTDYKIYVENREDALNLYKLLKALFIMRTELEEFYNFEVRIDEESNIEFYYDDEKLTLNELPDFIYREYEKISNELVRNSNLSKKLEKQLMKAKKYSFRLEREFLDKERQISTYLEYKKTFFGKIKIFFTGKKKKENSYTEEYEEEVEDVSLNASDLIETKSNYTIEDLVILYSRYNKIQKNARNLEMDLEAITLKNKNLEKRIENATLYIREIENHKKSIFEFWRFANKDEMPALVEGEEAPTNKKLNKVFNYELDMEDLGSKMDKWQRQVLTKEEMNSAFLAKTNAIEGINITRKEELSMNDEKKLKKLLDSLKSELTKESAGKTDFDIFGSMIDDRTQIKTIANKHHRENEKNKLQILGINKNTNVEELIERLMNADDSIRRAIPKVKFLYNMPVYKAVAGGGLKQNTLNVFSLNPLSCIKGYNDDEVNLYKIYLTEGQNALFYSNIMFFDNTNQTLPVGMNVSDDILIDLRNLNLKIVAKKTFLTNINSNDDEFAGKLNVTKFNVYEYENDEIDDEEAIIAAADMEC